MMRNTDARVDRTLDRLLKNQRIAKTRQLTLQRHRSKVCKTYELKVDKSHLSKETLGTLRMIFLEAKWFYNDLIAKGDVLHAVYNSRAVEARNKDGNSETRILQCLSAQMRQEILDRARDAIRGLARLKKNGHKVGPLKFKSRFR